LCCPIRLIEESIVEAVVVTVFGVVGFGVVEVVVEVDCVAAFVVLMLGLVL